MTTYAARFGRDKKIPMAIPFTVCFRAKYSGFRVQGSGFRVQGSGFRVQGSGSRVQG